MGLKSHQVVLVTGASRGIGRATAIKLAADGFAVIVNYCSNQTAADEVVGSIQDLGVSGMAIRADVSSESEVIDMFKRADALGTLVGLVNNVGILTTRMSLATMDAARINRVLAVNVTGTMLCAREAAARMSTNRGGGGGAIVNVSSAAARLGSPGEYVDYAASKGAVDTFTVGLAKELATEGVRVNCVRPGHIYTDIHATSGAPDRVNEVKHTVPMQRGGKPEEIAAAVAWLMSPAASYVTGAILDVTGGK